MTSTLRQVPRYVVGSVNLTEFSITFATSATFIVTLESGGLQKKWIFFAPALAAFFSVSNACLNF